MQLIAGLLIGVLVGVGLMLIPLKIIIVDYRPIGDLRVDRSDPNDAPLLFLELDSGTNVGTIMRCKRAVFRVKLENFLPHE